MGADENLRRAKDIYAAFDGGDIDSIVDALAENVKWGVHTSVENDIPWFGSFNSPSEVAERFFGGVAETTDIQVFERKSYVASGNQVAVSYHLQVKFKKNGNSYIDDGMNLWTFSDDGKVLEWAGYADTAAVLKAWNG